MSVGHGHNSDLQSGRLALPTALRVLNREHASQPEHEHAADEAQRRHSSMTR